METPSEDFSLQKSESGKRVAEEGGEASGGTAASSLLKQDRPDTSAGCQLAWWRTQSCQWEGATGKLLWKVELSPVGRWAEVLTPHCPHGEGCHPGLPGRTL